MMNYRFYNARLLTMAPDTPIIHGELWVEGNRIAYVGDAPPSPAPAFQREIDLGGNLLLPGFKNAHAHSPMTFLRSFADDLPLGEWLEQQVFPMEAKLTPEDAQVFTKLAILEYLSSGITASFEMYIYPDAVAKAGEEIGFRTVLCGSMNDFTGSVEELESFYLRHNIHPLTTAFLGFHAEYTTSPRRIEGVARLAEKYKAPVFTHLSESKNEVEECVLRHGLTPPQYLDKMGIWQHGGGGYHCIHMEEADLDLFEEKGLFCVTNPGSNVKLASGVAPLVQMHQRGIPLAIGTDGPASNNALDFFREMYLTSTLQKVYNHDAAAMDADTVLHMATVGGAQAMGLADADILAPGKLADLIVLDLSSPNMQPLNNLTKNIVYSGSKSNVALTMIDGQILYEKGEFHVGFDPEELYQQCNQLMETFK